MAAQNAPFPLRRCSGLLLASLALDLRTLVPNCNHCPLISTVTRKSRQPENVRVNGIFRAKPNNVVSMHTFHGGNVPGGKQPAWNLLGGIFRSPITRNNLRAKFIRPNLKILQSYNLNFFLNTRQIMQANLLNYASNLNFSLATSGWPAT